MIEEPYRWLEAIGNRREYIREQIKEGSPVFGASLAEGILLVGVGSGQSKVFEIFDRHAMAGLGHPADIEKVRQGAIDAAHMDAFARAAEDVTLRRLIGFGLSSQLKAAFEQVFGAPYLVELAFVELHAAAEEDVFMRLHFDGSFDYSRDGMVVAAGRPDMEEKAARWLKEQWAPGVDRRRAVNLFLQAWWCMVEKKSFEELPAEADREQGWRQALADRVVEIGWLDRQSARLARYQPLNLKDVGL